MFFPCFTQIICRVPSGQGRVFALAAALLMCQISTAGAALEARGTVVNMVNPNSYLEKTCLLFPEIIWLTWLALLAT